MVRAAVSSTDVQLLAAVRDRGVLISSTQLERWREAGIVPRNRRRGRGRGRGSASAYEPGSVDAATVMGMLNRNGVSGNAALLEWFIGVSYTLTTPKMRMSIPEPPAEPVRHALVWHESRQRQAWDNRTFVPRHCTDEDIDEAYEIAERAARRHIVRDPLAGEIVRRHAMGESGLAGGPLRLRAARAALVHAAVIQEVGADVVHPGALAEAFIQRQAEVPDDDQWAAVDSSVVIMQVAEDQLRAGRDLAQSLVRYSSLCRIMRWDDDTAEIVETVAEKFRRHGFEVLLAPGRTALKPMNIVPLVTLLLHEYNYCAAAQLLDDLGPNPFGIE